MRIESRFQQCADRGEGALVLYLTAGDPSLERLPSLLLTLQEAGADMVEVGVPFSDPLADGPSIQAAMQRALERGTTLAGVLETVAACKNQIQIPLIIFTYYNPVLQYGLERFAKEAREAGFDGCLMTDLIPDEAGEWLPYAYERELAPIFLLAPTSTDARIRLVAERARGFIYCVSRTGVTGAREQLPPDLPELVHRIRSHTTLPIAVGFGISKPEHVRQACALANGAVIGSQLVDTLHQYRGSPHLLEVVHLFVSAMKEATRSKGVQGNPEANQGL